MFKQYYYNKTIIKSFRHNNPENFITVNTKCNKNHTFTPILNEYTISPNYNNDVRFPFKMSYYIKPVNIAGVK